MRMILVLVVGFTLAGSAAAQQPNLDTLLERTRAFIDRFDERMASVVAEEEYRQHVEAHPQPAPSRKPRPDGPIPITRIPAVQSRTLRSDYALVQGGNGAWVGFRDTFEVDGAAVRDREDRLQRLLAGDAVGQAERIARESARYNIGTEFVLRTINVPTLALEMLHRNNRRRVSFRRAAGDTIAGMLVWRIDFEERTRPTFVQGVGNGDQRSRGSVWVEPGTGDIRRTMIWWERRTANIAVDYGRVPAIDVLVPIMMSEHYETPEVLVTGEAIYSNYRQFQTGARILLP
jgi:hypothetical protein